MSMDLDALRALANAHEAPISAHSGNIVPGAIFVALPKAAPATDKGLEYSDAATHVASAVAAGAKYIVCTGETAARAGLHEAAGVCLVNDPRAALGALAAAWHGTAHSGVQLLGITGTNGKTTSTYLLEIIMRSAGRVPGVIGTVAYRWPNHEEPSPLTTPDCLTLHSMVAAMGKAGADAALMEVSSHAIDQGRIAGLPFAGALFTNLTQDHLDYHGTMEAYFAVKAKLFTPASQGGLAGPTSALAVNVDDAYGQRLRAVNSAILGFSLRQREKDLLCGEILAQGPTGLHLRMRYGGESWDVASPLVGEFNAANLLGAQALALALGIDKAAFGVLETFSGVPGRLERIANRKNLAIFVDYAHTPDALEKALRALRGAGFVRIVTVFGCGGNRDRTKRPLMGQAAAALSDVVVLTSDNPRREEPEAIMADVRPGLTRAQEVIEEVDRKKAIGLAIEQLHTGDALLIAGKGHEPYQIIGDVRYPFSDQQVVREYLGCA